MTMPALRSATTVLSLLAAGPAFAQATNGGGGGSAILSNGGISSATGSGGAGPLANRGSPILIFAPCPVFLPRSRNHTI
jgi:hypothetical protein